MTFLCSQLLCCPHDKLPLTEQGKSLRCEQSHSFDIARQGYVNLLGVGDKRSRDPGDSKAMVAARRAFLDAGYYQPLATRFASIVLGNVKDGQVMLDAGCGDGYYLAKLRDLALARGRPGPDIMGYDISKWAVQAAAGRFDGCWFVASNRRIPLARGVHMVTSLFGFPDYTGFRNVLLPGGLVLELSAGPDHLVEMRELLYPELKPYRQPAWTRAEAAGFQLVETIPFKFQSELPDRDAVENLLIMTPHMYRAPAAGKERLRALQGLRITVDVRFDLLSLTEG